MTGGRHPPRSDRKGHESMRIGGESGSARGRAEALPVEVARNEPSQGREIEGFLETAPVPFHCVDAGGLIRWANAAELELLGYEAAEFVGRNIAEFHADQEAGKQILEKLSQHGDLRAYEARIRRRDGSICDVAIDSSWCRSGDEFVYAWCFVRDISRHKRLQDRLARKSLEAQLIHRATTLAAETDSFEDALEGCVEIVCEMTGWPIGHVFLPDTERQELLSTNIWHFDEPGAYDALRAVTERTRFTRSVDLPGRIWRDGEPVWIVDVSESDHFTRGAFCNELGVKGAFGFPIQIRNETVAILEFFAKDEMAPDHNLLLMVRSVGEQMGRVLERRRAQNEQARLATIVDTSYDAIISKSLDGTIMSWNAGAQHVFGYTTEEAVGQPISLIVPEDRAAEAAQLLESIKRGKRLEQFETVRMCKDGRRIYVSLTASPITDGVGRIIGASAIERDITGRIRAQEELQKAKDAAEAANRLKSEFLANISHELRTPMNAIIGMTDLSLNESLDEHVREYLQTARESASALLVLLNDILDLSRIESGKMTLESKRFDLRQTVEGALKEFRRAASEKGVKLSYRIDPSTPDALCGDPVRLHQVLSNLVGNAVKFTEKGSVLLDVAAHSPGDCEASVHFTVTDTGIGLSVADRQRIFAPFTQADASTTRHFGGAGLGLAICRKLTHMMRGRLWVESQLGRGSRFHFTACFEVPAEHAEPQAKPEAGRQMSDTPADAAGGLREGRDADSPQPAARPARVLKILIAEDTPANQKVVKAILEKRGHRVEIVRNGRHVVARAQQGDFDLILMDVQMPEMDGFQATRMIRSAGDPRVACIPIVAITAHAMRGDRERCLDAGMDTYLAKPVDAREMIAMIESMANHPTERHSAETSPTAAQASARRDPSVCNLDEALARLGGNAELLRDIIGFFREDAPELLEQMRTAIRGRNAEELARAAHSLKGLAANFSGKSTVEAALKVEQAGESANFAVAPDHVDRLADEAGRLCEALATYPPGETSAAAG